MENVLDAVVRAEPLAEIREGGRARGLGNGIGSGGGFGCSHWWRSCGTRSAVAFTGAGSLPSFALIVTHWRKRKRRLEEDVGYTAWVLRMWDSENEEKSRQLNKGNFRPPAWRLGWHRFRQQRGAECGVMRATFTFVRSITTKFSLTPNTEPKGRVK